MLDGRREPDPLVDPLQLAFLGDFLPRRNLGNPIGARKVPIACLAGGIDYGPRKFSRSSGKVARIALMTAPGFGRVSTLFIGVDICAVKPGRVRALAKRRHVGSLL